MKKYRIFITETNYGSVVVEAESEAEARDRATESYSEGCLEISRGDIKVTKVEVDE